MLVFFFYFLCKANGMPLVIDVYEWLNLYTSFILLEIRGKKKKVFEMQIQWLKSIPSWNYTLKRMKRRF